MTNYMRCPDIEAGFRQVIEPSSGRILVNALLREKGVITDWVLRLQLRKDGSNGLIKALLE